MIALSVGGLVGCASPEQIRSSVAGRSLVVQLPPNVEYLPVEGPEGTAVKVRYAPIKLSSGVSFSIASNIKRAVETRSSSNKAAYVVRFEAEFNKIVKTWINSSIIYNLRMNILDQSGRSVGRVLCTGLGDGNAPSRSVEEWRNPATMEAERRRIVDRCTAYFLSSLRQ